MILISHRGNVNGSDTQQENSPNYIQKTLDLGFDVEIDVWVKNDKIFLGHDEPKYEININWLTDRKEKLWVHCKNVECVIFFNSCVNTFNYFWHENDTLTLTSKNFMWVYPGNQPVKNSIAVLPEKFNDNVDLCLGICSDNILYYLNKE